jgi:hypothetical protein
MGEDNTEVNNEVRVSGRVTITEAATLLGVHPNTVRGRVKAGVYDAEKVATEHGLTWMIDRDSLVNNPLPRGPQHDPSQMVNPEGATTMEVVQDLLRPFVEDLGRVREELGAERVRREQAERERDELLEALRGVMETPEAASPRFVSGAESSDPQGPSEEPVQPRMMWWPVMRGSSRPASPRSDRGTALEDTQEPAQRRSWWRRFFGFE